MTVLFIENSNRMFFLLDVQDEAIRWEWEGMPSEARARSYSLPSVCARQYQVQGRSEVGRSTSRGSEMSEIREMLKQQQEQIKQLSQSVSLLQNPRRQYHKDSPIISRRCERPGHFARNCDNERVVPQAPSTSSLPAAQMTHQSSGNWYPLTCRAAVQKGPSLAQVLSWWV